MTMVGLLSDLGADHLTSWGMVFFENNKMIPISSEKNKMIMIFSEKI